MSRAAVLSLILALAAGPNVSWVCVVLCTDAPVASECQHQTPAASVTSAAVNCCEIASPNSGGFVPQVVRQSGLALDNELPGQILRSPFDASLTETRRPTGQSPGSAQNRHSFSLALRI